MGAKTPVNEQEKRATLTCEECQRNFQNIAAIKSHTMAKHPEKYKLMKSSVTPTTEEKKTAFVPPTSRVSKRLQLQKGSIDKDSQSEDSSSSVSDRSKVVFECPQCLKLFRVYFSALKHIQKYHCVDGDGNPLSPDSLALIKPVIKEMCKICEKLMQGEEHSCKGTVSGVAEPHEKGKYSCLGCQRNFFSVASFDDHVAGTHNENTDILIFSNMNEFLTWKTKTESQVRVKYLTLSNTTQRQYYQCNYVSHKNSADITHLCPSMIVTREFSKGIHIRYYKDHHGHVNSTLTKNNDGMFDVLLKDDVGDLYDKFKSLLKSIVVGASKINETNLRKLYNAALEMQKNLITYKEQVRVEKLTENTERQNFDEADDVSLCSVDDYDEPNEITDVSIHQGPDREETTDTNRYQKSTDGEADITNKDVDDNQTETILNKSMNDDQITKVLEAPRTSARLKRKSETLTSFESKKSKLDTDKDSSETEPETKIINSAGDVKFDSPKAKKSSPISQSPSFNDTYKQFIDNSIKPTDDGKTETRSKIGRKTNSKEDSTIKPTEINVDRTVESTVDKKVDNSLRPKVEKKNTTPTTKKIKKEIVKTKMGQFVSPKKAALMTEISKNVDSTEKKRKKGPNKQLQTSIADINLEDVEYEVVEQENDCNILILKI